MDSYVKITTDEYDGLKNIQRAFHEDGVVYIVPDYGIGRYQYVFKTKQKAIENMEKSFNEELKRVKGILSNMSVKEFKEFKKTGGKFI